MSNRVARQLITSSACQLRPLGWAVRLAVTSSAQSLSPSARLRNYARRWMSRNLAELLRWWEDGKLKPLIAKTFSLAEAGAALNALLSRRYAGKVVLET
jgi:NADPH:quinone reductase-like Zn-dependent oxidoreductase